VADDDHRVRARSRHSLERTLVSLAFTSWATGALVCAALLWHEEASAKLWITVGSVVVGVGCLSLVELRERLQRALQALANVLGALRGGDFSVRALEGEPDDALTQVYQELNDLVDELRTQRFGAYEATALLRAVMDQIDVVVVAFDPDDRVRLVNPVGARVLGGTEAMIIGKSATELAIAGWLTVPSPSTVVLTTDVGPGRWEIRRTEFRQAGVPHRLVVLNEIQRAQREEERRAWQRLVRVLGHEINNSLTPISSIAASLRALLESPNRSSDWEDDMRAGLDVVARRGQGLARFMSAYAQLARLPPPRFAPVDVVAWLARVASLERRVPVEVEPGESLEIEADGDQLDQLLINLVCNAADAALETHGSVQIRWSVSARRSVVVSVLDDGAGISEGRDLFVPFYTTKPTGSGIGLALARQIAEAHGGTLTLANRVGEAGCEARLVLPLRAAKPDGRA
jgi:nitrogen fixation/metabolism regulation signal transduction histidine kinase